MDPALLALAPRAFENLYHVGYLVPDLRLAMATFGERLQITWATPFEMPSGFVTADGEPDSDLVRIAFSIGGPPHLELIEVVPRAGSIFAEPAGGGVHHVGIYADRWRDEVARLVAEGMELERTGAGVAFVRDPHLGLRIEVVSFKGRDFLTRILSGALGAEFPLGGPPPAD
jgi:catechol 2,3-dioxygenase-like lactoylglutathione lyase family enzyme